MRHLPRVRSPPRRPRAAPGGASSRARQPAVQGAEHQLALKGGPHVEPEHPDAEDRPKDVGPAVQVQRPRQ